MLASTSRSTATSTSAASSLNPQTSTSSVQLPGKRKEPKLRSTCDACQEAKSRCSRESPCYRCIHYDVECVYSLSRRIGRPPRAKSPKEANKRRPKQKRGIHPSNDSEDSGPATSQAVEPQPSAASITPQRTPQQVSAPSNQNIVGLVEKDGILLDNNNANWPENGSWSESRDVESTHTSSISGEEISRLQPPLSNIGYESPFDFVDCPMFEMTQHDAILLDDEISSYPTAQASRKLPTISAISSYSNNGLPDYSQHSEARAIAGDQRQAAFKLCVPTGSSRDTTGIDRIKPNHHQTPPNSQLSFQQRSRRQMSSKPPAPSTSYSSGSSKFGSGRSTEYHCNCYDSVLQELGSFDQSQSSAVTFSIDLVLVHEQSAQLLTAQILQCNTCSNNRSDLLLLTALTINNTVSMFESVSSFGANSYNQSSLVKFLSFQNSSRGTYNNDSIKIEDNSLLELMDSRPLLAGGFEIILEEKRDFMKQFLRKRISRLSSTLQQLQQRMSHVPQNLMSQTGLLLVSESHRRLQSVIGRLEIWNG